MHAAFCMVAPAVTSKTDPCEPLPPPPHRLQASMFLRLPRDAGGCVPVAALFCYCTARSAQIHLVRAAAAA